MTQAMNTLIRLIINITKINKYNTNHENHQKTRNAVSFSVGKISYSDLDYSKPENMLPRGEKYLGKSISQKYLQFCQDSFNKYTEDTR